MKAKENKKRQKHQVTPLTLFEKTDAFFAKHEKIWFWLIFGITAITGIMLYDPRVSAGGDDSTYIMLAHDFLTDFKFVNFQGPLYPIMLSVVEVIFGMSVKAFKIFSMLSMLACMYFMFRAFRKQIPSTLLFITLLLTSFNSHVLYFASQTYSEAFYMFMQSLLLFVFFKYFVSRHCEERSNPATGQHTGLLHCVRNDAARHLLLAVVLLAVINTRSAGYSVFIAILGYFILYRQWKNLAWSAVCFVACFAAFHLLVNLVWNDVSIQASGQMNSLLNKDFYRPELGREDFAGFLERFWTNSNQYISRFFMVMLGFRDTFTADGYYVKTIPIITIIVYLLGLTCLWFSYKQNKYLFFSGIVTGTFLIVTFVILQAQWNQYRLIVPVYPLMLLILFSAVYYVLDMPKLRSFQFLLFVPLLIIFFCSLSDTSQAVKKAQKLTNEYSGLTPDWRNYLMTSAWVKKNLPDSAFVACRQPAISAIYAKGKKFYRIGRVNSGNFNLFVERWKTDSLAFSTVSIEGMNEQMYNAMLGQIEARLYIGEKYFFVIKDKAFIREFSAYFEDAQIIESPSEFEVLANTANMQKSIYYADSLLAPLRRANVTHILTANLRLNPNHKDGQTINTVERLASFIQDKYPGIFQKVIQTGEPDDEPASIYQINWEVVE